MYGIDRRNLRKYVNERKETMKIITFEDIKRMNISPSSCFDWAEMMIKNKSQALLPPKISMKPANGIFCNIMPCMIPGVEKNNWGG